MGGNKNSNYYSLTNNELNRINTSNNAIMYLGDYYVNNLYKISLINIMYQWFIIIIFICKIIIYLYIVYVFGTIEQYNDN